MLTITTTGFAEQAITKSKFLAWAAHCQSEQEVGAFLRVIAAQRQTAHHLAYAFRIKILDCIVPRFSDAGEPSGTAGKPILQMLEGRDLINVCVGVIRYYGGVNLGTGGLARAYGGTARLALDAAIIAPYVEMRALQLHIPYNRLDELTKAVGQIKGVILDKHFVDGVQVKLNVPAHEAEKLSSRFKETYATKHAKT